MKDGSRAETQMVGLSKTNPRPKPQYQLQVTHNTASSEMPEFEYWLIALNGLNARGNFGLMCSDLS